ncbi:MAG: hypothetical protein EA359_17960 [Balneolaceae bacterium]|nr:MAG: hypothetical protein EA359_17960 [Balneolaceae bacterium]
MEVNNFKTSKRLQILTAAVAIVFGLVTGFAGGRVLLDISDPGYSVFFPLLIFNTVMGFVYIATGVLIWTTIQKGIIASKMIFLLNLAVFCIVLFLFISGEKVAVDSVMAMGFRTIVWGIIFWSVTKLQRFFYK